MENEYRHILKQTISIANDDEAYYKDYTSACAFWMLTTLKYLPTVKERDEFQGSGPVPLHSLWKPEDNWVRPRIITRLQTFIAISNKYNHLISLRLIVEIIIEKLYEVWPEIKPLALYLAFQ